MPHDDQHYWPQATQLVVKKPLPVEKPIRSLLAAVDCQAKRS
jgi:hypothetical protein